MNRTTNPKIVIAGGGFAGLSAAMYLDKTLARREEAEVTLIRSVFLQGKRANDHLARC